MPLFAILLVFLWDQVVYIVVWWYKTESKRIFEKESFLSPQPGGCQKWPFYTVKMAENVPNLQLGWKPIQKW